MYVMLTGRPPFSGKTSLDVIHKHQFAQFDRPALIATDIPKQLDEIVCKLLEKDPEKRFPDSYVLSLRLIEVQKRFAWQSAEEANAAADAAAISAVDLTDAGNQPRPTDDDALAPTVLIPDAKGHVIPVGPTISASARQPRSPDEPAMGATRTYSSGQAVERRSDETRAVDGYSQGPGTIMRNLMRKVIDEQKDGGPIGQVLNNTWLQILALLLLLGGGYWVFHSEKVTTDQPLDDTATELEKIESDVSRFVKIKDNDGKVDPEGKRQLRQALMMYQLGEIARAEKKLEALIVLTKEQKEPRSVRALAERFRDALVSDRKVAFGAITDAFARANQFAEQKQLAEAEQLWQAVIDLYADDPKMDVDVQTARKKLAASKGNEP
jgi:serine/threonine-protein kinase